FFRTSNTGMLVAHVDLCDFCTGTASGIGDFEVHLGRLVRGRCRSDGEILVGKRGVGKTVAKGKQRFGSRLVVAPITYEYALGVHHLLISAFGIVGVVRGILLPVPLESHG